MSTSTHSLRFALVCLAFISGICVHNREAFTQTYTATAPSQLPSSSTRFKRSEDVLIFINAYRENKSPELVPEAVQAMVRLGLIKDPEKAGIYIGFIAGVIGDNQIEAERLIAKMFPLPPTAQVVLIKAIAYSDLPNWKALLGTFVERMPARKVLIKRYLYGQKGLTLRELPLHEDPQVLDAFWGYYFATGRYDAVFPIISTLAWSAEGDDVDKLTTASMSKWTLASNATRDKNLLDLLKNEINHQPAKVRVQLHEIVQAAETYELATIRKNALQQIETLKVKGPESRRNLVSWGETGTTVLALGCVVASVLGQVALGIPCVVGGALSQAAVSYVKKNGPLPAALAGGAAAY